MKNKLEEGLKQDLELQKTKIISLISESKTEYNLKSNSELQNTIAKVILIRKTKII